MKLEHLYPFTTQQLRRTRCIALCLLLVSAIGLIHAGETIYTTQNIPKVHLQDRSRYACNPDGILSTAACDSIDRMLFALEEKTGIETVVAVLGSIGQEDCFQFAHKLFNEWGVGKKKSNNGLVILLVLDQREIRFVTGAGLEGDLPDALCKRIQSRYMVKPFKKGDWDRGMVAGVEAVCKTLDGSMEAEESEEDEDVITAMLVFAGIFLIAIVIVIWAVYNISKCPNCGKHKLIRTASRLLYRRGGVKKEEITYTCTNCGHIVRRQQSSYDDKYQGGGSGPILFGGGGGRGGFGGGGFGGGSFGGGFSAGGGAGSRF